MKRFEEIDVFDSIASIDPFVVQHALRFIENELLVLALANASPRVCEAVIQCLSEEVRPLLQEDLEVARRRGLDAKFEKIARRQFLAIINLVLEADAGEGSLDS